MTESDAQKQILDWLKLKGFYCLRINSGNIAQSYHGDTRYIQLAPRGTPDVFCIVNGCPVFIEVKKDEKAINQWKKQWENFQKTARVTPYNQRSVDQHKQMNKIREAGGFTIVACDAKMVEDDLIALSILTR